jgi:hypothetical protein
MRTGLFTPVVLSLTPLAASFYCDFGVMLLALIRHITPHGAARFNDGLRRMRKVPFVAMALANLAGRAFVSRGVGSFLVSHDKAPTGITVPSRVIHDDGVCIKNLLQLERVPM